MKNKFAGLNFDSVEVLTQEEKMKVKGGYSAADGWDKWGPGMITNVPPYFGPVPCVNCAPPSPGDSPCFEMENGELTSDPSKGTQTWKKGCNNN